jgi:hypothetical protein
MPCWERRWQSSNDELCLKKQLVTSRTFDDRRLARRKLIRCAAGEYLATQVGKGLLSPRHCQF